MPGNNLDWIAIATAGSQDDGGFIAWTYINGQMSGMHTFGGLPVGNYEARAYVDNTYTVLARASFTVAASTVTTVSTDQTLYTSSSQPITVSWTNMPGNQFDWVAITDAGAPPSSGFHAWTYINGQMNGSTVFSGLPAGDYEARAYLDNDYTILASSPFSVTSASVSTNKQIYAPNEQVTVSWTGLPGNQQDWVTIATAGSPDNSGFTQFVYVNGQTSGSFAFSGLPAGDYEARAYFDNTYTVLARSSFTVTNATVTTDMTTYPNGAPITVSYTNLPGNIADWIAISDVNAPDTSVIQWVYTGGNTSGSAQFTGIGPGTYEARAYYDNTYMILARSAPFVVSEVSACTSGGQAPVFESMTSGDLVIDAMQAQNTFAVTLPLDRTILFTSVRESEPSPRYGGVTCQLHDVDMVQMLPAGITCDRANAGTDSGTGQIVIHYTAVTFSSGVFVQRGLANTNAANPASISLSTIDPTQSFVLLGGTLVGGSGWGNNEFVRAQLTGAQTLDIRTAVNGTQVAWQVVNMTGTNVQRGTTSLGSGVTQQQVSITSAPAGSLVLASYTTDNASGIEASSLMLQTTLVDTTTVAFDRDTGGSALNVSWEVISLPFATHAGSTQLGAGTSSATEPVAGNFSSASSVAIATTQALLGQATGSTSYAGPALDLPGEASVTLTTGTNSVSLQRASSQASADISWTVIDFAHDCNGQ
jgi:hypothetical protein